MGTHTEVLDGLSGVLWSSQQNNVAASWGSHGQLVESQALTAGLLDSGTGSGGESQSSDGQLGDDVHSVVVGDCADDCDGLALVGLLGGWGADFAVDAGEGHGWAVDSRHEQSLEDDLVEVGIGSSCASSVLLVLGLVVSVVLTGKESVELDKQLQIRVVALGCLSVAGPDVMTVKIDT